MGTVTRYYRYLPAELVLRDAVEDLVRPAINLRRTRYAVSIWGRPKVLRYTGTLFCVLKGVGAGEPTPEPLPSTIWQTHVQEEGAWREVTELNHNTDWRHEI